jgi:hypothetical protein
MKLMFSRGGVEPLWIDGSLPLKPKEGRRVKVTFEGKSDAPFPPALRPYGDLLCGERPSPLQHYITLLVDFPLSTTLAPAVQEGGGWWSMPGSTVWGQIRVALSAEAIALLQPVEAETHNYELTLEGVELVSKVS